MSQPLACPQKEKAKPTFHLLRKADIFILLRNNLFKVGAEQPSQVLKGVCPLLI